MKIESKVQILDGGMGRELKRRGAPFRRPEWSALALIEEPSAVQAVHEDFITAGAEIITTNSYAVVPFHIGEETFIKKGKALIELSGKLAQDAKQKLNTNAVVAGCIPPLFGSYRADLFDAKQANAIAKPLITGLDSYADIWLLETQSLIAEVEYILPLINKMSDNEKPIWVAFTLEDDVQHAKVEPKLRSGETVEQAINALVTMMDTHKVEAVLFNCCQPEVIEHALIVANKTLANKEVNLKTGAYANAFPPQKKDVDVTEFNNEVLDLTPVEYLEWAKIWANSGASIIGGCCGIGPEHIAVLSNGLN